MTVASNARPLISLRGVRKSFGHHEVLRISEGMQLRPG